MTVSASRQPGPEGRPAAPTATASARVTPLAPLPPADLLAAIEAYADYLRVERGLAAATIRAYDSDLRLFGRDAPGIGGWATSPEPARGYLASMTRPPRLLRPTSLRRKAAAIRAFYRFCYAEELIDADIASLIDLPRQVQRLPDTLDVQEVAGAPGCDRRRRTILGRATGPCWSSCTPRACASARRSASTARTSR